LERGADAGIGQNSAGAGISVRIVERAFERYDAASAWGLVLVLDGPSWRRSVDTLAAFAELPPPPPPEALTSPL
jgi:hypothetical protein